ncbi:unnamed protein product, partial [Discosporangium mesarthrocarpum]
PIDPELKDYILSFEPETSAAMLGDALALREPCLRNLQVSETLLREGVATGLNLYDIACIIRREEFDKRSELEQLVAHAAELARAAVDHHSSVLPAGKRTVHVKNHSNLNGLSASATVALGR